MSSAETLASAGRLLFGDRWQRAMGRAIGVDGSLISRWSTGERDTVAPWAVEQIPTLLRREAQRRAREAQEMVSLADRIESVTVK